MKKWHLSVIAVLLYAVVEGWPAFKKWNMERDFLSDDLVEAGQCIVALEYVSSDIGQTGPSWSGEARELYDHALDSVTKKSRDELTNIDGKMSIARYQVAVSARMNNYSNLAINRAREEVGWGTGEIDRRLVKKWATSELCQKARKTYLGKIEAKVDVRTRLNTEIADKSTKSDAENQSEPSEATQYSSNVEAAVHQKTNESVVVKEVNGYSESGDGYSFSTQAGITYYVYNAGGTRPRFGEEHIKPKAKICVVLNPEDGMGDVSSVMEGMCSQE